MNLYITESLHCYTHFFTSSFEIQNSAFEIWCSKFDIL